MPACASTTNFVDRGLGLPPDAGLDFARAVVEATGVYKRELATAPLDRRVEAIPRRTGLVLDDGDALADEAVEKGGLAYVRPPDDGNETTAHGCKPRPRVSPRAL
jgi:hypothetical protein